VVTPIDGLLPSIHIQLRDSNTQISIIQYPLSSMIDLTSDEKYCDPYILTFTNRVQYFAQAVVELHSGDIRLERRKEWIDSKTGSVKQHIPASYHCRE
jgi:hypothetical protein